MPNNSTLFGRFLGIFKGFAESGHEFIAEIVTPYHQEFVPLLGSFILVRVSDTEALLGRITQFYPVGTMAGAEAEEYLALLQKIDRPVPEDVKELKLRYSVKVRLLGTVCRDKSRFDYRPGVRTLPHLGAGVATLPDEVLSFVCNVRLQEEEDSVSIGYYSLGAQTFGSTEVKFSFARLHAKRTFVFARAGYGKSNLVKLLVAKFCEKERDAGMVIFDPEGEYSFRDALGRPGLADIPDVRERLVIFTNRKVSRENEPLVAGTVSLNLASIKPYKIASICLPESVQEGGWVNRVRGFSQQEWSDTVKVLSTSRYKTPPEELKHFVKMKEDKKTGLSKEVTDTTAVGAAIRRLTPIIMSLHDPKSKLPKCLIELLKGGKIVVIDTSLLSTGNAERICGLILDEIFDHNVRQFTERDSGAVIPVVAVIEEAQNVLSAEKMKQEDSPFVRWVKEGRKYSLGSIIVTQQPGAISDQLLSQGDNFFVMHLVSSVDLQCLQRSNAHFSDDILSFILNEPIEGNVYFWSAPSQPYVISARLFSFEDYAKSGLKS